MAVIYLGSNLAGGPQGEQGPQGPAGPQGPQGPRGPQGNTGSSVDYPYELVNNLTEGGVDKALTAEQGKVLGDALFGGFSPVDLSQFTEQNCSLGSNGWYNMSGQKHIAVPVIEGESLRLSNETSGSGSGFYVFCTSSYSPPYSNGAAIPKVGSSNRDTLAFGSSVDLVAPATAAYLILTLVDGGNNRNTWTLSKYGQSGLAAQMDELYPVVMGSPTEVHKELILQPLAFQNGGNRVDTMSVDSLLAGDVATFKLSSYSTYQILIGIRDEPIWGATERYSTGWKSEDLTVTILPEYAGKYIRFGVRRPNDASLYGELPTIQGLITEMRVERDSEEMGGGLVQYVGVPVGDPVNVDLSQYTQSSGSLGGNGWYLQNAASKHIAVPVTPDEKVTLSHDSGGGGYYAFVKSTYTPPTNDGQSVPYAGGASARSELVIGASINLVAPSDAAYLILTMVDGVSQGNTWTLVKYDKTNIIPIFDEIANLKMQMSGAGGGMPKIRVAHWNVGHFALGVSDDTTITQANYAEMRAKWAAKINDIGADIFGACEYNENFVNASGGSPAITAKDAIFSLFAYNAIGTKYSYNMNAIFSNLSLASITSVNFSARTQSRYYIVADVVIAGKVVKVVETHLDWDEGGSGATNRAAQIQQLISDFADDDYVIIGADWNVADEDEYDALVSAGYNMANHGYLGDIPTYPAGASVDCLDNIVCKGFAISKIETIDDATLTDHCAVYADFTLIP